MRKLKVKEIYLLCLFIPLLLQGCMFRYDFDYPYEVAAEEKGETFAKALKVKDVKTIKGLFSPYARKNIKDFDEKIDELVNYVDGKIISTKVSSTGGSSSSGEITYTDIGVCIDVKTDKSTYVFGIADRANAEMDNRIGLYGISVYNEKVDGDDIWRSRRGKIPAIMLFYDEKTLKCVRKTREKGEILIKALKEKKVESIKGLLSKYAKTEIEDLDSKIESWMNYIQGNIVSVKMYTKFGCSYSGLDSKYTHNLIRIKVKTEQANYEIAATYCVSDEQKDKLGILYLDVINEKDMEGEDWYIYRGSPNIRYISEVPADDSSHGFDW